MTAVPVWHGRIDNDGHFLLSEDERDARREYLQSLAGARVEITVRKERTQRSIDQNAYLHAVPFPILAEHFGNSIEEVKYVLMGECFGWHTVAGREIPVKPSTSGMSVEECSRFIEWLIPWAMMEHGCAIPLPNEVELR